MSSHIAAYYYPTTIAIIDDNKHFLNNICFRLDELFTYSLFDWSAAALEYFNSKYIFDPIASRCLINNQSVNFEIICKEATNHSRFEEVSVMIVDYNMPTHNGIEFCEQVKHLPIKRMLVTGTATQAQAIDAFNRGLIDKFIIKDTTHFDEELNQSLKELRYRYFQDISESIIKPLQAEEKCILNHPAYADFFKAFCKQNQIVEFYLYNAQGSFLLLDADANVSWFIVESTANLKAGNKLFFAPPLPDLNQTQGAETDSYLHPAKPLEIDPTFSYAFIQNKNEWWPDCKRILAYSKHLQCFWPN